MSIQSNVINTPVHKTSSPYSVSRVESSDLKIVSCSDCLMTNIHAQSAPERFTLTEGSDDLDNKGCSEEWGLQIVWFCFLTSAVMPSCFGLNFGFILKIILWYSLILFCTFQSILSFAKTKKYILARELAKKTSFSRHITSSC